MIHELISEDQPVEYFSELHVGDKYVIAESAIYTKIVKRFGIFNCKKSFSRFVFRKIEESETNG